MTTTNVLLDLQLLLKQNSTLNSRCNKTVNCFTNKSIYMFFYRENDRCHIQNKTELSNFEFKANVVVVLVAITTTKRLLDLLLKQNFTLHINKG